MTQSPCVQQKKVLILACYHRKRWPSRRALPSFCPMDSGIFRPQSRPTLHFSLAPSRSRRPLEVRLGQPASWIYWRKYHSDFFRVCWLFWVCVFQGCLVSRSVGDWYDRRYNNDRMSDKGGAFFLGAGRGGCSWCSHGINTQYERTRMLYLWHLATMDDSVTPCYFFYLKHASFFLVFRCICYDFVYIDLRMTAWWMQLISLPSSISVSFFFCFVISQVECTSTFNRYANPFLAILLINCRGVSAGVYD